MPEHTSYISSDIVCSCNLNSIDFQTFNDVRGNAILGYKAMLCMRRRKQKLLKF